MNSAQLFRELPYNSIEFIEVHGQFNNSLNNNLTTKKQLQCLKSLNDLDVFSLNINTSVNEVTFSMEIWHHFNQKAHAPLVLCCAFR